MLAVNQSEAACIFETVMTLHLIRSRVLSSPLNSEWLLYNKLSTSELSCPWQNRAALKTQLVCMNKELETLKSKHSEASEKLLEKTRQYQKLQVSMYEMQLWVSTECADHVFIVCVLCPTGNVWSPQEVTRRLLCVGCRLFPSLGAMWHPLHSREKGRKLRHEEWPSGSLISH